MRLFISFQKRHNWHITIWGTTNWFDTFILQYDYQCKLAKLSVMSHNDHLVLPVVREFPTDSGAQTISGRKYQNKQTNKVIISRYIISNVIKSKIKKSV